MITSRRNNSSLLQGIFILLVLMICLLEIFPDLYYISNIAIVVLLFAHYLLSNQMVLKGSDILIAFFALFIIALTRDIARISIFVFFLFLQSKNFYTKLPVKQYLWILLSCFTLVLIAYCFGFNQEYDRLSWDRVDQTFIEEKGLGFVNPNRCMLNFFCISCLMLLLTQKTWHYLSILAVNYILYGFTQSRTYFYVIVLIVAALMVLKMLRCETRYSFIGRAMPFAYLALFALSVILPIFFSGTFLNDLFTGRLVHNKAFIDAGITMLGNVQLETATFDSSYLHMFLVKGIIFFAVFSFLLVRGCQKAQISNKRAVILGTIFMASFMEVIFLEANIMYLIGATLYFKENEASSHG